MPILFAKNFQSRKDLDSDVSKLTSLDAVVIKGTREELKRLHLSERTTVFGVLCEVTDPGLKKKVFEKPERGEIFKSKLIYGE